MSTDQVSGVAIAANQDRYLVAWGGATGIRGSFLAAGGRLRLGSGRLLSVLYPNQQHSPAVGFDGENYLVVWEDYRDPAGGAAIYGTRVSRSGRVLDPSGLRLWASAGSPHTPIVAFGKDSYLVLWTEERVGGADLLGMLVDRSGQVLHRTSPLPISIAEGDLYEPAVSYGGGRFLVVCNDARENQPLRGVRVSETGKLLDPDGLVIASPGVHLRPKVAFGEGRFLVVWESQSALDNSEIRGTRLTPGGTVLDPNPLLIFSGSSRPRVPTVASDGRDFLVAWNDFVDVKPAIFSARVTHFGTVLNPGTVLAEGRLGPLSFQGARYLLVWEDLSDVLTLRAASVLRDGSRLTGGRMWLARTGSGLLGVSVAPDGRGNYLVAYARRLDTAEREASYRVRARLLSP